MLDVQGLMLVEHKKRIRFRYSRKSVSYERVRETITGVNDPTDTEAAALTGLWMKWVNIEGITAKEMIATPFWLKIQTSKQVNLILTVPS